VTRVRIRVVPGAPQVLDVRATGRGLLWIDGNSPLSDRDAVVPDPVRIFADRARSGFFSDTTVHVNESWFDARTCEQGWTLSVESLGLGALRVLAHLLLARDVDTLDIQTRSRDAVAMIEAIPSAYPLAPSSPGFCFEPKNDAAEARLVRIELVRPPTDDELGELYTLFEAWVDLLLLGGYPADGKLPARSGVVPVFAVLIEAAVVEQQFDEFFLPQGRLPLVAACRCALARTPPARAADSDPLTRVSSRLRTLPAITVPPFTLDG
jgi:hypothetical protein